MAVPLLALMPPAFLLLVMIWRDMLFGVAWLLAAAIVYAAATAPPRIRRPIQCIALALIAFGVLLRPTAIIAAPLLAAYVIWPTRFDGKRAVLAFLPGLVIGFAIVHLVYYVILDVKRENPLHSLLVFDLGGITHFTGENQFPVSWTADETALLTSTCYNDERWDSYWTMEPCRFVMRRLEAQDDLIFGTPRLPQAWLRAVAAHPGAYLRHRLTYFWRFLTGPNITLELYHANDPAWTPLARNSYFRTLVDWHDALKASVLFRPGFWLIIAALTGALAWRLRGTPSGAFAIGVTSSAVVFVLTFFPLGVAAEFRYGYWE